MNFSFDPNQYDILNSIPPLQDGKTVCCGMYQAFGFSMQGKSHVKKGAPCQDNNDIRFLQKEGLLIAGIADGVGSCSLSHWGAYIAVKASLDYVEQAVYSCKNPDFFSDDTWMYNCLVESFRHACASVEKAAAASGQRSAEMQSTLTVAIYNGRHLWCCHAGDDGVVVQYGDGFVKMVTRRQKGEEASSVYPLQSGEAHWEIHKVASREHGNVAAFVMATDGVLDAFVFDAKQYVEDAGCCNGVYYPFIRSAIYDDASKNRKACDPQARLAEYQQMMSGDDYRSKVTDDLTFISVVSPARLLRAVIPAFDVNAWQRVTQAIFQQRMQNLYPGTQKIHSEHNEIPETSGAVNFVGTPASGKTNDPDPVIYLNESDVRKKGEPRTKRPVYRQNKNAGKMGFAFPGSMQASQRRLIIMICGGLIILVMGIILGIWLTAGFSKDIDAPDVIVATPSEVSYAEADELPAAEQTHTDAGRSF